MNISGSTVESKFVNDFEKRERFRNPSSDSKR